jgi:hypothetical protein
MKRQRNAKQIQAKLFPELGPASGPIPLDLPADRAVELQKLVGELLLRVAREAAAAPGGDEYDE